MKDWFERLAEYDAHGREWLKGLVLMFKIVREAGEKKK
jgi:hypothetical protein